MLTSQSSADSNSHGSRKQNWNQKCRWEVILGTPKHDVGIADGASTLSFLWILVNTHTQDSEFV